MIFMTFIDTSHFTFDNNNLRASKKYKVFYEILLTVSDILEEFRNSFSTFNLLSSFSLENTRLKILSL